MMKATIIMGSPRGKKGASSRVAHHFSAGLRRAGVEVEEIMLKDYSINHCLGCYTCWAKTPGKCVHRDDMDMLLPKMQTDLVVWATPLYTYSVPGLVKDVLDRRIPLLEPFLVKKGEVTGHPVRGAGKLADTFLISVAGFPERSHFDALVAMFKKFTGSKYLGDILIGGSEPMSREELQVAYAELYTLIEQAGFEVGKDGQMSQATAHAILENTTYSPEKIEEFRKMANAYWESLIPKEPAQKQKVETSGGRELKLSDGGLATLLAGMAMRYNPKGIPGFAGVIQFDFEQETYHVLIKDGQCKAYEGEHPEPDLTIITSKQVWFDISGGKLDGSKAFMEGLYKTEGDMSLMMRFNQLFSAGQEESTDTVSANGEKENLSGDVDDKIPEHRGPIKLPAMLWLTVAFLPWMVKWIASVVLPEALARYLAAGIAVLIAGYHVSTNVITLFETGTAIYLLISAGLTASGWAFFQMFGSVLDYLFLSGLWFSSLTKRFALTAEYSRYLFPKVIWGQRSFRETNMIICAAWGGYFLVAAVLAMMTASGFGSLLTEIARYVLLVPMFIFTDRFQKWYPAKLMRTNYSFSEK